MEKRITEKEALKLLDKESYARYKEIMSKYPNVPKGGRDGYYTQDLKILSNEFGKRYFKLKEAYSKNDTLSEDELTDIIKGKI